MAEHAQEQLLGYLLDALEDEERREVEEELSRDPLLQQQLESLHSMLGALEPTRDEAAPPADLAGRACRRAWEQADESTAAAAEHPSPRGRLHAMGSDASLGGGGPRLHWLDVVTAACVLLVASMLIFPALQNSRVQARIGQCAKNLHDIHVGLAQYGDAFDGLFPVAPPSDRLGGGGGFAVVLQSTGYTTDPYQYVCPSSPMAELARFSIPAAEHVYSMPEGEALEQTLASLNGSYSMSLGYEENDRFQGLRNLGRSDFALISDTPGPARANFLSDNHGGGRNILFEDGHVRFTREPVSNKSHDHFFLNAEGRIGPGCNRHDSVIPPAGRLPLVLTGGR